MSSFQFLHAADLHLDSPLRGLAARGDGARAFLSASRRALTALVDAAIARKVAFVVIAGDIYDGDWRDYSTGQVFVREMGRLAREEIPVFMLRGNHDAESVITKQLTPPANVREFSTARAQTFTLDALRVALHGRGFAARQAGEDIAQTYPPAVAGWVNIGGLPTSPDRRRGPHAYSPTRVEHLRRLGYDYWALGHIHAREIVSRDPWIVFPGNLQGRHARETGAKGASLVRVVNGAVADVEALALDAARFDHVRLDLAGALSEDDLREAARDALAQAAARAQGRPLALRVTLEGASALHERLLAHRAQNEENMQALASEAGADILIEKLMIATSSARAAPPAALDGFHEILDEVANDPAFRAEVAEALKSMRAKAAPGAYALAGRGDPEADAPVAVAAALAALRAALADDSEARS